MTNHLVRLDKVIDSLFVVLGALSRNLTEADLKEMEAMGMKPNRALHHEARRRYHAHRRNSLKRVK